MVYGREIGKRGYDGYWRNAEKRAEPRAAQAPGRLRDDRHDPLLEGRVIVTNNVPDFESLRRARDAVGGQVPGLIYTSDLAFPRTKAYVSRLVAALEAAVAGHATARHGGVLWLRPPGA